MSSFELISLDTGDKVLRAPKKEDEGILQGGSKVYGDQPVIGSVTNLQALRDAKYQRMKDGDVIYSKANTAQGDGGEGNFRLVTDAAPGTYVDNNGTIIVPTGGDGSAAWLKDFSNSYVPGGYKFRYLTGERDSLSGNVPKGIAVGDTINITQYSEDSPVCPATWQLVDDDAVLPEGAAAGDVTGAARGCLYLANGDAYYKFGLTGDLYVTALGAMGYGADDTLPIQAAYHHQSDTTIEWTGTGSQRGCSIPVVLPRGEYGISKEIGIPSKYSTTKADEAVLVKLNDFTGTRALYSGGNGWRITIEGLQFQDFEEMIYLHSNNANSGRVLIKRCGFFNATENAIRLECRSSISIIEDCIFRSCKRELTIDRGDLVVMRGGWISRGVLTDDYDGGIVVGTGDSNFYMEDVICVPTPQTVAEHCWIKNYGQVFCSGVRFGGEGAGHCIVNNYSAGSAATADTKRVVSFTGGCNLDVAAGEPIVRLFNIPNIIHVEGNRGLRTSLCSYVAWSSTIDSASQATKISATNTLNGGVGSLYYGIDIRGNSNSLGVSRQAPENLIHLLSSMSNFSLVGQSGSGAERIFAFDYRQSAIATGDIYGGLTWIGRDQSGSASGVRAAMRVRATGTSGGVETVFFNTANASAVEKEIAKIDNSSFSPASDNSVSLGGVSFRWSSVYAVNSFASNFRPGDGTPIWTSGAGAPEGAVTAPIGSMYTRTDGGAGTTLYIKETGSGNTGWVAK